MAEVEITFAELDTMLKSVGRRAIDECSNCCLRVEERYLTKKIYKTTLFESNFYN